MRFPTLDALRSACLDLGPGDDDAAEAALARQDTLTKPQGSLGRLEEIAVWLARWQGRAMPKLDRVQVVVFAGSLPRGVEPDVYASLIRELKRTGVTTVIDTDGEPLRHAVRAEPDIVSPNVLEAEELVGHEFAGDTERSLAVREIAALGAREAIMTLPDGCFAQVLVDGQPRLKRARVEPREPIAKRGSGDAFLAGYLAARYEGRPPDQCLRFGVACGAESTGRFGAGLIDPREARRLMGEVELFDVELPAEVT